jgi:hypothetical protein
MSEAKTQTPAEYVQYQIVYFRALWHMYQAKRWLRKAMVTAEKLAKFIDECKERGEDTRALAVSREHASLVAMIAKVEEMTKELHPDVELEAALEKFNKQADELLAQDDSDPYAN